MTGLLVDERITALQQERNRLLLELSRVRIDMRGLRSRLQYARKPVPRKEDLALLADARLQLGQDVIAIGFLVELVRLLAARRPGAEEAERALLRLAIRQGVDLGPRPPLTGVRRGLWRAWTTWGWRDAPSPSRRERWRRVRATFAGLCDEARIEVEAIEGPSIESIARAVQNDFDVRASLLLEEQGPA